ncbi:hypothetical protein D3C78_1472600 [compost metagenome]
MRWKPSTTIFSPAARPPVTIQRLPTARSTSIGRRCTFWSAALTTSTLALPAMSRVTACWGTSKASGATPVGSKACTYMPGISTPSGLGTTARSVTTPVLGFTITPANCSLPVWEYRRPSSSLSWTAKASRSSCS